MGGDHTCRGCGALQGMPHRDGCTVGTFDTIVSEQQVLHDPMPRPRIGRCRVCDRPEGTTHSVGCTVGPSNAVVTRDATELAEPERPDYEKWARDNADRHPELAQLYATLFVGEQVQALRGDLRELARTRPAGLR